MGLRSPATGTDAAAWQGTDWAAPGEMFDKLLERLSRRKPSHWIVAAARRLDQAEVPDASEVSAVRRGASARGRERTGARGRVGVLVYGGV